MAAFRVSRGCCSRFCWGKGTNGVFVTCDNSRKLFPVRCVTVSLQVNPARRGEGGLRKKKTRFVLQYHHARLGLGATVLNDNATIYFEVHGLLDLLFAGVHLISEKPPP